MTLLADFQQYEVLTFTVSICDNVLIYIYLIYLEHCHGCSFVQDNVTVSGECTNGRDFRARYKLSYTSDSGTLNTACVVDGTECSDGTCYHELQSNTADSRCQPPVSQFSGDSVTVSVTSRNIVGRSNPAVSRSISEF